MLKGDDSMESRYIKKASLILLCMITMVQIFDIPALSSPVAYPVQINRVRLTGSSIETELRTVREFKSGMYTAVMIKSLGAGIIDEYHRKGYTAAFLDSLVIRKDGILEIQIYESRISGILVNGADDQTADQIQNYILPQKKVVYNEYDLKKRISDSRKIFRLKRIVTRPVRTQSGDIFLDIDVKQKKGGNFYGMVGLDMAYGISPILGYSHIYRRSSLDINAQAGYRDGEFRKAEGNIRYSVFFPGTGLSVFFGLGSSRTVDAWQSGLTDYTSVAVAPQTGLQYSTGIMDLSLYFRERVIFLSGYSSEKRTVHDSSLNMDIQISNRSRLLDIRETDSVRFSVTGGYDNLNGSVYVISSIYAEMSFLPFDWLRIVPSAGLCYTSSEERFFHSYVFDHNLIGFFSDYTASEWKNTAGIETEFRIVEDMLYAGPFLNTGYFIDEYDKWKLNTGTGIKCRLVYGRISLVLYYAWDIKKNPSEGGVVFMAEGRF